MLERLTKKEHVLLVDFIHTASICRNIEDLNGLIIAKLKTIVPFEAASAILSHKRNSDQLKLFVTFNVNYPVEYVNEYIAGGYAACDPLVKECLGVDRLCYWEDAVIRHGISKTLLNLSDDFGFKLARKGYGYCHGIVNPSGSDVGLMAFYGLKRNDRTEFMLSVCAQHLREAMKRVHGCCNVSGSLSRREKEILQWLASGKSTWDVSMILRISERTVKFHMDNIMRKLDAVNRTHAVALALRQNLIDFD